MTRSDDQTMRVDPPTARAPSGAARRRFRFVGLIGALVSLSLLVCGFELLSCLAGLLHPHRGWMLAAGLGATALLPLVVGLWLRRSGGRKRRQPSSLVMVALLNGALLAGCGLLAPSACKRAVKAHGSWWVVWIAGEGAAARGSRQLFGQLLELLPGTAVLAPQRPKPPTVAQTDGSAPPRDAGVVVPDLEADLPTGADLQPSAGPVRVTFERRGSGIVVPVVLHGPGGTVQAKMLFDTGASLSTIDRATADRLGLIFDARDPTIVTHTAAGKVRRVLNIVDAVDIAGARVSGGLAVTLCDPCADGKVIGLLGLNYSRHFKVTLDPEAGRMTLEAKEKRLTHLRDIRPFVELKEAQGMRRGPQMTVKLTLHNRSGRRLRGVRVVAVVKVGKKTSRIWTEIAGVPPRSAVPVTIEGLLPQEGNRFTVDLEAADW